MICECHGIINMYQVRDYYFTVCLKCRETKGPFDTVQEAKDAHPKELIRPLTNPRYIYRQR